MTGSELGTGDLSRLLPQKAASVGHFAIEKIDGEAANPTSASFPGNGLHQPLDP